MKGSVDESGSDSSEFWKIIHIPQKPPIHPHLQPTVDVVVSAIEPKHANTIVRKLYHIASLEGLRHVKRIRKSCLHGGGCRSSILCASHPHYLPLILVSLSMTARLPTGKSQLFVILCMACGDNDQYSCMSKDVLELVNMYRLSTFTTKVCKYAALTKEEWVEQCKLWPTSFHPPTYNIDGITGFSEEDSLSVFNFMKLAVRMAKSGISVVNAVVIVDPSTRKVIASSCDQVLLCDALTNSSSRESCSCEEPEATMQYDVNEMEKDPTWLLQRSSNEAKQSYKDVACLHPLGWLEQQLHSSSDSWHPLRHAAIVSIEKSAARDKHLFPVNDRAADFDQDDDYKVSSPIGSPLNRQKVNTNVKNDERMDCHKKGSKCESTRPYLCTGYDIYFVWEPCVMCSMAIVHQRIRRVFYALPNPTNGALGSVHRLQGERSLNHHYAVFRVVLPKEVLN